MKGSPTGYGLRSTNCGDDCHRQVDGNGWRWRKSAFWRQIFADILDIDVVKTSIDQEAATLGAAAIAFKALGLWADFTPLRSIHQIEAISRPSPQTHATYTNGLSGYRLAAEQQHILSGPLQAYRQAANH